MYVCLFLFCVNIVLIIRLDVYICSCAYLLMCILDVHICWCEYLLMWYLLMRMFVDAHIFWCVYFLMCIFMYSPLYLPLEALLSHAGLRCLVLLWLFWWIYDIYVSIIHLESRPFVCDKYAIYVCTYLLEALLSTLGFAVGLELGVYTHIPGLIIRFSLSFL